MHCVYEEKILQEKQNCNSYQPNYMQKLISKTICLHIIIILLPEQYSIDLV